MPNYFAIGFFGIMVTVGVGLEYHRQSVQAGVPMSEFGPARFVAGVKDSVSSTIKERSENIAEVRRASKWQGEMRKHLPEAPEGWARRGYDEGDNTAVIPAGQKTTGAYGREHPLTQFKNETFANFKNLKHVYKKEVSGQSDEDFHLGMLQASTYVYEKGDETVLIELLKKDEVETKSMAGRGLALSLARDISSEKFAKEPEVFAVIAGIPFYEAFDEEGLMFGHYRVLYAKIGLHEEVRMVVHANASSASTREILRAIDFEALNGLLRIPMSHVSNDLVLRDKKTEHKFAGISNYFRTTGEINLTTHLLLQQRPGRTRQKPSSLVRKYGAETPLRDMYVMQYRDAMQRLVEIDDLAGQIVNMDDLLYGADGGEEIIEEAQMEEQVIEKPVATAAATSDEPEAPAPTMSAPLRRELESMDRSTKVKARLAPKPAKADRRKSSEARKILEEARAQQAKTNKASAKEVKVNRLVQGSGARRKGKRSGCGAGSFCRVSE